MEEKALPKISGGVLVIDRVPYHLKRTPETVPAVSLVRKAELAQWLADHDVVPNHWEETWRQSRTKAQMKAVADANKPASQFLVQDLAAGFGISVLISPVAHTELNPMKWYGAPSRWR